MEDEKLFEALQYLAIDPNILEQLDDESLKILAN